MWISFGMSTPAWRLSNGHIYDLPVGRPFRGQPEIEMLNFTDKLAHVAMEESIWKCLYIWQGPNGIEYNFCHFYSIKNTPSRKHTWLPRWLTSLNFHWWRLSGGRRLSCMTNLHPSWTASERVSGCKQVWTSLLSLCLWMLRLMILLDILLGTVKTF